LTYLYFSIMTTEIEEILLEELSKVEFPIEKPIEVTNKIPRYGKNEKKATKNLLSELNLYSMHYSYPYERKESLVDDFLIISELAHNYKPTSFYSQRLKKEIISSTAGYSYACYISSNATKIEFEHKLSGNLIFMVMLKLDNINYSKINEVSNIDDGTILYDAIGFCEEFKNIFSGIKKATNFSRKEVSELLTEDTYCVDVNQSESATFRFVLNSKHIQNE